MFARHTNSNTLVTRDLVKVGNKTYKKFVCGFTICDMQHKHQFII